MAQVVIVVQFFARQAHVALRLHFVPTVSVIVETLVLSHFAPTILGVYSKVGELYAVWMLARLRVDPGVAVVPMVALLFRAVFTATKERLSCDAPSPFSDPFFQNN